MEKLAYLKGLLEGLGVHPESREGKILYTVCAVLDESEEYIKKLENRVSELEELYEVLDEDLGQLEDEVGTDDAYSGCAACPSDTKLSYHYDSKPLPEDAGADEFSDEEEEYETVCPTCGKVIVLDEQMLEDGETVCPNCGEELEFDFDEEEVQKLAPASDNDTE